MNPAVDRASDPPGDLWRALGASETEVGELVQYATDAFDFTQLPAAYPLPDEPFVQAWRSYAARGRGHGLLPCLREALVQLQFPVQAGASEDEMYRAATRRGLLPDGLAGFPPMELVDPAGLELRIHTTPAGRIPVLTVAARADFERLVQALTRRNEPWPVPASMGACLVAGYNNWGRIHALRARWQRRGARGDWAERLRAIVAQPALYQDRFILLSTGPYSATAAAELGLDPAAWHRRSHVIRLEHECTHYFTRQVLGSMRNALTDELIADYMGIVAAEGRYRADWFLRFVGLEDFPRYRPGARLENYRGTPPLSDGAFTVLQRAVHRSARNLEVVDQLRRRARRWDQAARARTIIALCRLGLSGLAAADAPARYRAADSEGSVARVGGLEAVVS